MHHQLPLRFDNSYARLPGRFYSRVAPEPAAGPVLIRVNEALARQLGIDADWLSSASGIEVIAGNRLPPGADPIATAYAGHQFGSWNPRLGDGRAILLGELTAADGARFDLQLKGSGRTPYSRGGDGRAPLGAVLREYVVSEAMAALGIPTTRTLAAASTGEWLWRDAEVPGAILVRVAQSHIRIGTLQYFSALRDIEGLRLLVEHVIARHYPDLAGAANPALALLQRVIARQAQLVARWQLTGFIHGVMNTDNMLLSGETIDYGPCAFMDGFDPDAVYSSIDQAGRYAYRNQPAIAHWNLVCLAGALLPVMEPDPDAAVAAAQQAVDAFAPQYEQAYRAGMARKLGIGRLRDGDDELIQDLLAVMADTRADFTLTFRSLADSVAARPPGGDVGGIYALPQALAPWLQRWRARLQGDALAAGARQAMMDAANPAYIPRNHLVEEVIAAAVQGGDLRPFHALVDRLAEPFAFDAAQARYALPPRPEQVVRQTFCGT